MLTDGLHAAWSGAETRMLAVRLLPGNDLRTSIEAIFSAQPEKAGYIAAAVGSLTSASLRPAGRDEAIRIDGPLEIVALSGTLAVEGLHLHIAVADASGAMTGGHLLRGSPVRTTCELVLALARGPRFHRRDDPRTSHAELFVEPAPNTAAPVPDPDADAKG